MLTAASWGVLSILRGLAKIVNDPVEKAALLRALMQYLQHSELSATDERYADMPKYVCVIVITPEEMTGKFRYLLGRK